MIRNNLLHCKAIIANDDVFAQDLYFVNESDRMEHHEEMLNTIVESELNAEVSYWEDMGQEMSYHQEMDMRYRIQETIKQRYVCHYTNKFRVYLN